MYPSFKKSLVPVLFITPALISTSVNAQTFKVEGGRTTKSEAVTTVTTKPLSSDTKWNGVYVGAQIGGGFARSAQSYTNTDAFYPGGNYQVNVNGQSVNRQVGNDPNLTDATGGAVEGGLEAGYNYHFKNIPLVLGLNTEIGGMGIFYPAGYATIAMANGNIPYVTEDTMNYRKGNLVWLTRLLGGVTPNINGDSNTMFYAFVGSAMILALPADQHLPTTTDFSYSNTSSLSSPSWGINFGIGAERYFSDQLSIKAELFFINIFPKSFYLKTTDIVGQVTSTGGGWGTPNQIFGMVRIGANYHIPNTAFIH